MPSVLTLPQSSTPRNGFQIQFQAEGLALHLSQVLNFVGILTDEFLSDSTLERRFR
jgi:hypothetical protein